MVAKKVEDRFQTMGEVISGLEAIPADGLAAGGYKETATWTPPGGDENASAQAVTSATMAKPLTACFRL